MGLMENLHVHPWHPPTPHCPIWKAHFHASCSILRGLYWPLSPTMAHEDGGSKSQQLLSPGWAQIHLPRVYPSAAVECVRPCPGAITVPLHTRFPQFITTIGACQLLLMIAQPLPMKETIDWQRRWGGWGLPRHYLYVFFSCILRYCSSWAAFCKLGQSVLYNVQSCCYFKSRFAAEIQVSKS